MYDMTTDNCICDFCGYEAKWDSVSESNGTFWECEHCGQQFCSKCFRDKYGDRALREMLRTFDKVCCPDCYEKHLDD